MIASSPVPISPFLSEWLVEGLLAQFPRGFDENSGSCHFFDIDDLLNRFLQPPTNFVSFTPCPFPADSPL
jgi:hypothetical protein